MNQKNFAPSNLATPDDFVLQSTSQISSPEHIAIIMDGNRRWAKERNLRAKDGHLRGLDRAVEVVRELGNSNVKHLTLFAFSAANWQRPTREVADLFSIARQALARFAPECAANSIRLRLLGRRDRIPAGLRHAALLAEQRTQLGTRTLNIAFDYDAQAAIIAAVRIAGEQATAEQISTELARTYGTPPVDLLIRTGREQRLSNFLLWECAFAELSFSDVLWPDFTREHLLAEIKTFQSRQRRYGA